MFYLSKSTVDFESLLCRPHHHLFVDCMSNINVLSKNVNGFRYIDIIKHLSVIHFVLNSGCLITDDLDGLIFLFQK